MRVSFFVFLLMVLGYGYSVSHPEYRFFQLKKVLFATDGTSFWQASSNLNNASNINLEMVGPFELFEPDSTALNFTRGNLKLAFVAKMQENCTVLVLVNHQLDYELWHILINANFRAATQKAKQLFKLEEISDSESCELEVPMTGNLLFLPPLNPFFEANQTVTSVLSSKSNKELYLVGTNHYLKINLEKWSSIDDEGLFEEGIVHLQRFNATFSPDRVMALYSKSVLENYVVVQTGIGTQACNLISLASMTISNSCKPISYTFRSAAKVNERTFDVQPGRLADYQDKPTESKGNSKVLIMVASIIGLVLILILVYILASKFCCHDSSPTIPFSTLNSKFVGKLQSTSSIKTLKSQDDILTTKKVGNSPGDGIKLRK